LNDDHKGQARVTTTTTPTPEHTSRLHRPAWFKPEVSAGQVIAFAGMLLAFGFGAAELKSSLRSEISEVRTAQQVNRQRADELERRVGKVEAEVGTLESNVTGQLQALRSEQREAFDRLDDKLDGKVDRQ
jgi:TolA-binding protein